MATVSVDPMDKNIQHARLRMLTSGRGYGVLLALSRPNYSIVFAVSPAPELRDLEFVCASPEGTYDIWKFDRMIEANLTLEETQQYIRDRTPAWMYDESEFTEEHQRTLALWMEQLKLRYPW